MDRLHTYQNKVGHPDLLILHPQKLIFHFAPQQIRRPSGKKPSFSIETTPFSKIFIFMMILVNDHTTQHVDTRWQYFTWNFGCNFLHCRYVKFVILSHEFGFLDETTQIILFKQYINIEVENHELTSMNGALKEM